MPWFAWIFVTLVVISTLSLVADSAKTGAYRVAVVVINGLFLWGIIELGLNYHP